MKLKKLIAGAAVVALLPLSGAAVLANQVESPDYTSNEISEIASHSYFSSFAGTVKEVSDFEDARGTNLFVTVENADGQVANLVIPEDAFFVNDNEITVGAEVTGYFRANAPAPLIYPPQYNVSVVAVDLDEATFIKVDRFNENLTSQDGLLRLNINDDTTIVTQGGQAFEGELTNRKLVVFYDVSTRSIPAITTPNKVVVMYETVVPPIGNIDEGDLIEPPIGNLDDVAIDVSGWEIIVEGQRITGSGFTSEAGAVMVPLRAIAEAAGFEITWEWSATERLVMLDGDIALRIGDTTYFNNGTAIELPFAPELVNGTTTYVPLQFFRIVAGMNNAYAFEGQIVVNNEEVME